MITKIIETTCSVTPEGVPNRTKDIENFFDEMREKKPIIRAIEDDPKVLFYLLYMNDMFYIGRTDISFQQSDNTYSDEKHEVWKCEEPREFMKQLIKLGVYSKQKMAEEFLDFIINK